jgi:hypothetical protein
MEMLVEKTSFPLFYSGYPNLQKIPSRLLSAYEIPSDIIDESSLGKRSFFNVMWLVRDT